MGPRKGQGITVLSLDMNLERIHLSEHKTNSIAVAVTSQEHAAIAFRDMTGDLRLLHYFVDGKIRDTNFDEKYLLILPNLSPDESLAFAGLCVRLVQNSHLFKSLYDFGADPNACFDVGEGRCDLITTSPGTGLTCSTFVAAMFRSIQRPLIVISSWRYRPSDRTRYLEILQFLRDNKQAERAQVLANHIDRIRVGPFDVGGAALEDRLPASFRRCCRNAPVIRDIASRKSKAQSGEPIELASCIPTREFSIGRVWHAVSLATNAFGRAMQKLVGWWNRRNAR